MSNFVPRRKEPFLAEPVPDGLPRDLRLYLGHVVQGLSLRTLGKREGINASTVLRLVRRFEARRDDPLLGAHGQGLADGRHGRARPAAHH